MKLNIEKSKTFSDRTGSLTPFYKKSTLRNKKIFHPNHLTKEDTTILPFSPNSKDILHKFNVKFKGIFKLFNL